MRAIPSTTRAIGPHCSGTESRGRDTYAEVELVVAVAVSLGAHGGHRDGLVGNEGHEQVDVVLGPHIVDAAVKQVAQLVECVRAPACPARVIRREVLFFSARRSMDHELSTEGRRPSACA